MNREEWIAEFAGKLGVEAPTQAEVDQLLDLAAVAAHSSERTAAPVASLLAGRTGRPLEELIEIAKTVAPEVPGADQP